MLEIKKKNFFSLLKTQGILGSIIMQNSVDQLKKEFEAFSSWEERYGAIIKWGKALPDLPLEHQTDQWKVKGCQSQVWLKPEFKEGRVHFYGDSDSILVRGLVALLLKVYSSQEPSTILSTSPQFLEDLGLKKHLTPNRANGVLAMIKQMMYYAQAFEALSLSQKGKGQ